MKNGYMLKESVGGVHQEWKRHISTDNSDACPHQGMPGNKAGIVHNY